MERIVFSRVQANKKLEKGQAYCAIICRKIIVVPCVAMFMII